MIVFFRVITILLELGALIGLISLLKPLRQWRIQFEQMKADLQGLIPQYNRKIKETGRLLDNMEAYLIAFQASRSWQTKIAWAMLQRMLRTPDKNNYRTPVNITASALQASSEARPHIVKA